MNDVARAGQVTLSAALVVGVVACLAFQWNRTHVFNPAWHPHARFHAVQLCLSFTALSAAGLWMTWWAPVGAGVAAGATATVPVAFWAGEFVALIVPGTDPSPNLDKPNTLSLMGRSVHGNLLFATIMIAASILGALMLGLSG